MKHRLSDRYLQTVKAPPAGRLVVADTEVRGLTVRVTASGTRTFLVRYRLPKQPQRSYTVKGAYPGTSLAEARQRARDIIAAAKRGIDLVVEEQRREPERQRAEATARTVSELVSEYIEKNCRPHHRRWRDVERRLLRHVTPVLGDRPADSVRRADIVELLDGLQHDKGLRQQVNRTRSALSAMFQYAIEHEYVETTNPVVGTRPRKLETDRNRILSDDELRAIWLALDAMPNPGRSFVRALVLTGARHSEVRRLPWAEINGDLWTLPAERNKAARDFEIPLSAQMNGLLAAMQKQGPYVFSIDGGEKPWTGTHRFKLALDRQSGVTGWVWHDIRRTVRSKLAELSVPYEIAERVLNHAMTKLERVYNRHSYRQEKAQALQRWADHLMGLVYADSKVVPLRPA
jgi:integrase